MYNAWCKTTQQLLLLTTIQEKTFCILLYEGFFYFLLFWRKQLANMREKVLNIAQPYICYIQSIQAIITLIIFYCTCCQLRQCGDEIMKDKKSAMPHKQALEWFNYHFSQRSMWLIVVCRVLRSFLLLLWLKFYVISSNRSSAVTA